MTKAKKPNISKSRAGKTAAVKSALKSGNTLQGTHIAKPGWLLGTLAVVVLVFFLYAYVTYGGINGLRYERQYFPGGNSAALTQPREELQAKMKAFNDRLKAMAGTQLVGTEPIQLVDACVKGEHNAPFAGATEDSYAYWCAINSRQYLTYASPPCEVVVAAIKQSVSFSTTEDCRSQAPALQTGAGKSNYYFSGSMQSLSPLVTINSTPHFIGQADNEFNAQFSFARTLESCASSGSIGRRQVYCQEQGIAKQKVLQEIRALPASVQTVVTIQYTQQTYYQK